MSEPRAITRGLAPLLEILELDQPHVVTTADLAAVAADVGLKWAPRDIARRLVEGGWLLPLVTRGAWEFAPAARAGAFGAGDPFVELRATLRKRPDSPFVVAAESAAYLLGLSSRRPDPEVIGAPVGARTTPSLEAFRVVRWQPAAPLRVIDGLPTWTVETLIAFLSSKPARYKDWPNVPEWIQSAFQELGIDMLKQELRDEARSSWMRAAYLAQRAGTYEASQQLLDGAPEGSGPYRLVAREESGTYYSRFDIVDSIDQWMTSE